MEKWDICPFIHFFKSRQTVYRNTGLLASRSGSCRDAGQHGTNPGHPGNPGWVATLAPTEGPNGFLQADPSTFRRYLTGKHALDKSRNVTH